MPKRYFTPDISIWKYVPTPKKKKQHRLKINDQQLDSIIDNSTEMMDFAISFTKTVVRISFVLFVIVNIFIMTMTILAFFKSNELMYMDTLITESYGMLRDVIAAYIIKAGTENALRIGFSVLSDYIERKYNIKVKPENEEDFNDEYDYSDEDPGIEKIDVEDESIDNTEEVEENTEPEESEDEESDGGIEFLR